MKNFDAAIWSNEDEHGDWMVEFVPCKKGADFSEKKFQDLTERWNKKIDAEGFDILMAISLVPVSSNEDYDMLWQQEFWTKDRDNFWRDWKENHEIKWNEENSSILLCDTDNILDFKASLRGKILPFDEHGYYQEFRYCNYKEGCSSSDLLAFEEGYQKEIKQLGIMGPCLSALFRPLSEHKKSSYDFVWHQCFNTLENQKSCSRILDTGMSNFVTFDSASHTGLKIR
jgi:hypothetical protein